MEKFYPNVGDQLFLYQRTGNEWVDMVKRPYTVVEVHSNRLVIQSCKYVWPTDENGNRVCYFDTIPERIEADPNGYKEELFWKPGVGRWGTKGRKEDYPQYACFGSYQYQPYLD